MSEEVIFNDILEPRRTQCGIFKFMSRTWNPQRTYEMDKYYSPQDLKALVAKSVYLDSVIEAESARTGIRKEELQRQVLEFLEEMGLEKKLSTIRWMGVVFLKISFMMKVGVFVNESAILKLWQLFTEILEFEKYFAEPKLKQLHTKTVTGLTSLLLYFINKLKKRELRSSMGANPVLFLPTHRSYADFCLMTYLCYNYDIDLPAVAAGMDFYSMAVVGRRMRETCAFYIRRTLAGAPLYAATLRQYVRTIVSRHCAPIEFFLEGTRSRSNKSLPPKYGMLSMALMPFFAREVSDITIVPVNISYDRLMETSLFAYEHLGVPKPKESTGGLLKALYSLNDHFGNIYINLGTPVSVREYVRLNSNSDEILKPVDLQQPTPEQFNQVQDIANYVIALQQESTVATVSNLIALVLMQSLIRNQPLALEEVLGETEWVITVLRRLGAAVFEKDVRSSVGRMLVVHRGMMRLDARSRLRLVAAKGGNFTEQVKNKMKGHVLLARTMESAVPMVQLQLYVNPVLHYLAPAALLALLARTPVRTEKMVNDYHHIRKLLRHEIFHIEKNEDATLQKAIEYCIAEGVIEHKEGSYTAGANRRVQFLLQCAVWPALATLTHCADVLTELGSCGHARALALVQARAESSGRCPPYCLSLDCIGNCLAGLALAGALTKERRQSEVVYLVVREQMARARRLAAAVLPALSVDFARNSVVLDHSAAVAKL